MAKVQIPFTFSIPMTVENKKSRFGHLGDLTITGVAYENGDYDINDITDPKGNSVYDIFCWLGCGNPKEVMEIAEPTQAHVEGMDFGNTERCYHTDVMQDYSEDVFASIPSIVDQVRRRA